MKKSNEVKYSATIERAQQAFSGSNLKDTWLILSIVSLPAIGVLSSLLLPIYYEPIKLSQSSFMLSIAVVVFTIVSFQSIFEVYSDGKEKIGHGVQRGGSFTHSAKTVGKIATYFNVTVIMSCGTAFYLCFISAYDLSHIDTPAGVGGMLVVLILMSLATINTLCMWVHRLSLLNQVQYYLSNTDITFSPVSNKRVVRP